MRPADPLGGVVYDAVRAALEDAGVAPKEPVRVPLADVRGHGAPSPRWVRTHAPEIIRGARGARYVLADELAAVLATVAVKKWLGVAKATTPATEDPRAEVLALAQKRAS